MKIFDIVYGQIEFAPWESELFHLPEIARLRDISQSTVPPVFVPVGICATRFDHLLGTAYLTKVLCELRSEFRPYRKELFFAGLLHDAGTPPFTHLSEHFMKDLIGTDHEEQVEALLRNPVVLQVLKKNKVDPGRVLAYINGKLKPLSDVINSSLDLDNLDNLLRFGLSTGTYRVDPYDPRTIISAFRYDGREVYFEDRAGRLRLELRKWERGRHGIYSYIYSTMNLAPGMMLDRAMGFAYARRQLPKSFFDLTDSEALSFLEHRTNPKTKFLIQEARNWNWYREVFRKQVRRIKESHWKLNDNVNEHIRWANHLSHELKIPAEHVCVCFWLNNGFRQIHYPIRRRGRLIGTHPSTSRNFFGLAVFIHSDHVHLKTKVARLMAKVS